MNTLSKILVGVLFSLGATMGPAYAAPGNAGEQPRLEILDTALTSCPVRGELCFATGSAATRTVGAEYGGDVTPNFTRITTPTSRTLGSTPDDSMPWTVEVSASLRQRALTGNVLFIVYDADDPKAMANNEVTALWQDNVRAGTNISARLAFSPDDGFHAGHTYRVNVVQILNGKHVILASGDIHLS